MSSDRVGNAKTSIMKIESGGSNRRSPELGRNNYENVGGLDRRVKKKKPDVVKLVRKPWALAAPRREARRETPQRPVFLPTATAVLFVST